MIRIGRRFPALVALGSASRRFFAWWREGLGGLVPPAIRSWWQETDHLVLVTFADGRPVFSRALGTKTEKLAMASGQTRPVGTVKGTRFMLEIAPDHVLQRSLALPMALEENLRQALTFELDRYTPFKPDRAYFDFLISGRDAVRKQITVELAVVPRTVVDQAVASAAALGIHIGGAVLVDDVLRFGNACRNLLPAGARTSHGLRGQFGVRLALLAGGILLLAAVLAIPLWQKRAAAISLLAPLAEARTAATETDALRDKLKRLVADHNLLPDKKWNGHSVVRALDDLTKRLPDDTFVIQFEFDGNTLQVQGESASSAKLIEILEDSPLFKDVGFKSPLVKIQGTANDRFHLAATLEATERQLADAEPKESRPAAERVMPPPPPSASQPPPLPTSAGAAPPAPATAATVATGTAAATPAARAAAGKAPTTNAAGGKQ